MGHGQTDMPDSRGTGIAQWWEYSPAANVAWVRVPDSASHVSWVCCWLSSLLREVFLHALQFSPPLKKPTFPNSNSYRTQWTKSRLVDMPLIIPSYFIFIYFPLLKTVEHKFERYGQTNSTLLLTTEHKSKVESISINKVAKRVLNSTVLNSIKRKCRPR